MACQMLKTIIWRWQPQKDFKSHTRLTNYVVGQRMNTKKCVWSDMIIITIVKSACEAVKQTFFSVWGVLSEKYPSRSTNWAALRPYAGSSGQMAQVNSSSSSCWDLLEFLQRYSHVSHRPGMWFHHLIVYFVHSLFIVVTCLFNDTSLKSSLGLN